MDGSFDQLLITVYENLIPIAKATGDLNSLSRIQANLISVKDRVFHSSVLRRVAMARVEFEEYRNQEQIARQADLIESKEKLLTRQKWLVLSTTLIAFLVAVIAVVLFRFSNYQKKVSALLDRRVFERTKELQASETMLVRKVGEQKALMEQLSIKINSSIATVRGLWNLATRQSQEGSLREFEKVAQDLLQISQIIDRSRAEARISSLYRGEKSNLNVNLKEAL